MQLSRISGVIIEEMPVAADDCHGCGMVVQEVPDGIRKAFGGEYIHGFRTGNIRIGNHCQLGSVFPEGMDAMAEKKTVVFVGFIVFVSFYYLIRFVVDDEPFCDFYCACRVVRMNTEKHVTVKPFHQCRAVYA